MSLSCNVVQDLVVLFQEDAVSEETKQEIRAHLKECRECRRVYKEYAHLNREESFHGEEPEAEEELQFAEIAARLRKNRNWGRFVVSVAFALAIGITVLVTRGILREKNGYGN
ncbi:MAG: zf-HC2 domain-containing protein [Lachnospiraceae bacterium]